MRCYATLKTKTVLESLQDFLQHQGEIFSILFRFLLCEIARKFTYFMNSSVTHLKSHVSRKL